VGPAPRVAANPAHRFNVPGFALAGQNPALRRNGRRLVGKLMIR
jgi:hypothetical protein